jgi:hypothetical protein
MPAEGTIYNEVEALIAEDDALECATDLAVALLNNYASCGYLMQAEQFFERLCRARPLVSVMLWNIMIKVSKSTQHRHTF